MALHSYWLLRKTRILTLVEHHLFTTPHTRAFYFVHFIVFSQPPKEVNAITPLYRWGNLNSKKE